MNTIRIKWFLFGIALALQVMPVVQGANKKEAPLPIPASSPAQQPDANKKEGPWFIALVKGWILPAANKKE
jgi:hypothetical protein